MHQLAAALLAYDESELLSTITSNVLDVTTPTATRLVRELESQGILRETTGRSWGRINLAPGVLTALEQRATT